MPIIYDVTYNPNPWKYGGLEWQETHKAKEDWRARTQEVENILNDIRLRTGTIKDIQKLDLASFRITVESTTMGGITILPTDIVQKLKERGFTVFEYQEISLYEIGKYSSVILSALHATYAVALFYSPLM